MVLFQITDRHLRSTAAFPTCLSASEKESGLFKEMQLYERGKAALDPPGEFTSNGSIMRLSKTLTYAYNTAVQRQKEGYISNKRPVRPAKVLAGIQGKT